MVWLITAVAEWIGPTWSGLLSPFPVFVTVMAVFSHRTAGPAAAIHVLRGVVIGSLAFACFFFIVALMLHRQGMLPTYSAATVGALLVNGMTVAKLLPIRKQA
jgi:hypothetical protein